MEQTKAEVAFAGSRIETKKAVQHLITARKQLAAGWGSTSPRFEKVRGDFETVIAVPSESDLVHLLKQNPDVARWAIAREKQQAALDLAQVQQIPDPTVSVGVQRFEEDEDTSFVLGVSIPLPFFDRNQGGIQEAKYNIAKVAEAQHAAEMAVYASMVEVYRSLSEAHMEATDLRNAVLPGARNAFDATRQAYQEGKLDYLSVLDSQRTLFEARGRYIEALAAYHKSKADLERLIGQSIDKKFKIKH